MKTMGPVYAIWPDQLNLCIMFCWHGLRQLIPLGGLAQLFTFRFTGISFFLLLLLLLYKCVLVLLSPVDELHLLWEIKIIVGFTYVCSVDDGFPVVNFQFKDSLSLPVYPHNYLFEVRVSKLDYFGWIIHCWFSCIWWFQKWFHFKVEKIKHSVFQQLWEFFALFLLIWKYLILLC